MIAPEQPGNGGEPPPTPREPKPGIPPGTPDWWGHADAPWSAETPELWVDEVDRNADWQEDGSTYWKALPRPHGAHTRFPSCCGRGSADKTRTETASARRPHRNRDTDKTAHEGRPDDRTRGCGQRGWVERPA